MADDEEIEEREAGEQIGIQSVETGMRIVAALADLTSAGPPPMLKTLAAQAGMPPAKAHRYIVSFMRTGLIERDPLSGRYRPGPMARQIGIAALQSLDVMRLSFGLLPSVRDQLGHTVGLAIWAYHGPTVVLVEEVQSAITISVRVGQVMPILTSATGRAFGAWAPRSQTAALLKSEFETAREPRPASSIHTIEEAEALFRLIRAQGIAYTAGGHNPLINALSAPIFDYRGTLVGALLSLGPSNSFDINPTGRTAEILKTAAIALSQSLGYKNTKELSQAP